MYRRSKTLARGTDPEAMYPRIKEHYAVEDTAKHEVRVKVTREVLPDRHPVGLMHRMRNPFDGAFALHLGLVGNPLWAFAFALAKRAEDGNKGVRRALAAFGNEFGHRHMARVSRFARRTYDHAVVKNRLMKLGIVLHSATEPLDDSATGKLMEGLLAAFAQFDNDLRTDNTVRGMTKLMEETGRWAFQSPLGYQKGPRNGGSMLPCPETGPLVRKAFEWIASDRFSQTEVQSKLRALGLRTRKGKIVSRQSLNKLLRNPLYKGRIEVAAWGISRQGDFEPLVTAEIWDAAQAVLDGRAPTVVPHERNHPDFPLRGFVRYAGCGKPLTGSWSTGRSRKYGNYRCRDRHVNVTKDRMEEAFIDLLRELRPRQQYLCLFKEVVLRVWDERLGEAVGIRQGLQRRIDDLLARRDRLNRIFIYDRAFDQDTYAEEKCRLDNEIGEARMELASASEDELDVEGILGFAEHLMLNADAIWKGADLNHRQRFQRLMFPNGLAFDGEAYRTAQSEQITSAFEWLRLAGEGKKDLVTPTGIEPVFSA